MEEEGTQGQKDFSLHGQVTEYLPLDLKQGCHGHIT